VTALAAITTSRRLSPIDSSADAHVRVTVSRTLAASSRALAARAMLLTNSP